TNTLNSLFDKEFNQRNLPCPLNILIRANISGYSLAPGVYFASGEEPTMPAILRRSLKLTLAAAIALVPAYLPVYAQSTGQDPQPPAPTQQPTTDAPKPDATKPDSTKTDSTKQDA